MNDKNKVYFIKLILITVIFVSFLIVLGLTAQLVKNKRIVNLQPQILVSPEPTVAPVVKDETVDWQIYKNNKYGFEVKYPLEFTFNSTGPNISQEVINKGEQIAGSVAPSFDTIIFSGKNNGVEEKFYISIFHSDERDISVKNYDDYLHVSGSCDTRWDFEPSVKKMERFNNIDVLEVNGKTSEGSSVACNYFKNQDNNLIVLNTDKFDNEKDFNRVNAILQKILSSIVLGNTADIADWKTYRYDKYGIEFKYPGTEWVLTYNIISSILTWAEKPIEPIESVNFYTQRAGNPAVDELSTTITFSVFNKIGKLSFLDWFSSAIPDMPKVKKGDLATALREANTGKTGLLTYNELKNNDIETASFGMVALGGYFNYSTYFYRTNSPYIYSIELNLPLRYDSVSSGAVASLSDPDEKYTEVYNQILSTFKFTNQ